ncbi:MAG: PAS domain-containing protein [Alphaproteobacteria bacterium]|jgi:hypothetical protein|nr:PAS domain-containing protein [Alphaproteobacteria bacterium]MDP6832318.1 PAS domain-containing protein [Alphaproteobacteria bacterium]
MSAHVDIRLNQSTIRENREYGMAGQVGGNTTGGVGYRHAQSGQFAAHMLSLPRRNMCPLRSAFDPAQIPDLLPRIILRERDDASVYKFRLVGTELQEYFGRKVVGLPIAAGMGEQAAQAMKVAFDRMIEHPCGLRCVMDIVLNLDQMAKVEVVYFPFAGASPPQQISHSAILERPVFVDITDTSTIGKLHEIEGIDLGAGLPDLSDISW